MRADEENTPAKNRARLAALRAGPKRKLGASAETAAKGVRTRKGASGPKAKVG